MKLELIREKASVFPIVEHPCQYHAAKVWHCSYKSLAPLSLFSELRELEIATFPDDDLSCLSGLQHLVKLEILHLPRVASLAPLASLQALHQLRLSTLPSWDISRKKTTVDSYRPLADLSNLARLSLLGVVPADGDITVLAQCGNLKELQTDNHFPAEQFAYLKVRMPGLQCTWFEPTINVPHNFCERCGLQKVMLSGVEKYNIKCPRCHSRRVQRHLDEWQKYMDDELDQ